MIRDTFDKIKAQENIRENLILLKTEVKEASGKTALLYYMGNDYTVLLELLSHEEAKVRKNAALIIGELGIEETLSSLYDAYEKEEQMFVRSAYLSAMKNFDYTCYLDKFEERVEELGATTLSSDNKKHVEEEMRILSQLIRKLKGVKKHTFSGYQVPSQVVLLTNRNHTEATLRQLDGVKAKEFNAGIIAECKDLNKILPVRTYSELLFMLEDIRNIEFDAVLGAKALAESSLLAFLEQRHEGLPPFYFRIELKAKVDLSKRSTFTKKLSAELERLTGRRMINSTSDYEWELRLIENREGRLNVLVKLYTLTDERFRYRKNVIAASIQPSVAALVAVLAKDYLKEGAQVLDPFCGVGTMLIERNSAVKAGTMYGLDVFGEAIERAKENTAANGDKIYYINRNFFDFKHEYPFDEIITNMPRAVGQREEDEVYELYKRFFIKTSEHLNKGGIIILYSHNRDYVHKSYNHSKYRILEEFEISKKEGAYVFVLKVIG
ncbi:methyltransferase [Anaerocolumna xylanovorans]|uniref:Putative RNA methylase family UPF0020 n=1 Tax=Anaerocolumna xylanovorans DSM 12503 TaxID=1121345 RepID=A0A1M7YN41_9FIRM|nr:methyltransferase [Anaerocolumna xylanovorans]SHO54034.1 Putative RNA methylase family UPF0020 [Anaerocolumna xylanovorans DSM 12503]